MYVDVPVRTIRSIYKVGSDYYKVIATIPHGNTPRLGGNH